MSVTLTRLVEVTAGRLAGRGTTVVRDVTHDSRQAGPGVLFVAVPGFQCDGHDFAPAAVAAGSPAVCVQRLVGVEAAQLVVADTRRSLPVLAAEIHQHPSRRLRLVGVTGTNGKTTVTHFLESIARTAGMGTGLIGTIETRLGARPIPNPRTTPEATDFQRLLAFMATGGAEVVAAEISSHALALGRVDDTWFSVVAFTNLSQDHLDFHGTMDAYEAAKASLFTTDRAERAVIWVDDPAGARLAAATDLPVLSVGLGGSPGGHPVPFARPADLTADLVAVGLEGSTLRIRLPDHERRARLRLGGHHNVANALLAAGCALALGIDGEAIAAGLEAVATVPGRMEVVSGDHQVRVVVDYAHTPDSITRVVEAVRRTGAGRLIVVVGAGGDRDRSKRPLMGAAAAGADLVVVTSDNPRGEEPEVIIDEVVAGIGGARFAREADRRAAIRMALGAARPGDVVLVLGKGHEQGQERDGVVVPFDDRLVAQEELAGLGGGHRVGSGGGQQ